MARACLSGAHGSALFYPVGVYIFYGKVCVYETLCQMYNAKLCFNFSKKFVMFDSEAAEDPTDHVVLEKTIWA
jgi:hypothetical protein